MKEIDVKDVYSTINVITETYSLEASEHDLYSNSEYLKHVFKLSLVFCISQSGIVKEGQEPKGDTFFVQFAQ